MGKVQKIRKGNSSLQLIDEDESTQPEPEPEPEHQGEGEEYDVDRAIKMKATRPLPMVEGKGKAITIEEQAAQSLLALHTPKRRSTTDQFIFQRRTLATKEASTGPSAQPQDDASANIVCDSPSHADAETSADTDKTNSGGNTEILQIGEEQGEDVDNQVNLEEKTAELDQGQAGSDPGKTPESRPPPEQVFMDEDQAGPDPGESHVALAGPNPEPTHDEFMANAYPNVHESLNFPADEHVILEDPLSSSDTLSSMKNLDDAYTIGDQFLNDKSTEDEPRKLNVEEEVVSMVTVLIYQASSSVPPLSIPVINLSPPKLVPSTTQAPIVTATTTTTLPLPPPPQQQSTIDSEVFTLELWDLPHKIDKTIHEAVKEAVYVALQAPLRDRFRELPEAIMKEILHQQMFESGTYKSLPEHVALYEALEAFMERANRDEFLAEKDKHDSDALGSKQPPAPQSSAWKTSDTREAPSSSSKQKSVPHFEQPVEDVPIPDNVNVSDSEDTDTTHLPKIKTRPDYSYQDPDEYKLLQQTSDMSSFIIWFCKRIRKKKLSKADLKGPYFKVVRPFHDNNISLQFQMEECHLLLTDQVDLVNPKGHRVVPNVSKPLPLGGPPAQYLDFGLEELVPSLWIESEHEYDISVRSHMRILSVVNLKTYERYGYTFLKEIVLRRADYNECKISEDDFKNLHPNDFENLYLLHLQDWDASDFLFKEDYTIVSKSRALDHMVKDFKMFKYNPGMETRIWSEDDRKRSKEFMEVIERRLKIRRIFTSLESFVGGWLRDVDYRLIQRTE
ncbi:hypothetical protein Tco_0513678 [Tanacetum coccineum]